MKRFLLFAAFILAAASAKAQWVDACMTVSINGTPQTIPANKNIWVCRGTPVSLTGNNCITAYPPGYNPSRLSYQWQYLKVPSTNVSYTGQTKIALDSGRWVLTVRYIDGPNAINEWATDTIWIRHYGTSIKITQKTPAGIAVKCAADSLLLTTTINPGAAAGTVSNYNWYVVGNPTPISTTDQVKVKNINYYAVTAQESTYGCTIRDTVFVNNYPNPAVNLGPDKSICNGNSVVLSTSVAPGPTVQWCTWYQNGVATGAPVPPLSTPTPNTPPPHTATTAGQYVLRLVAQGTGCTNSDTILVDARPGADFSLKDSSICFTDSVQIIPVETSVIPPATYTWAPSPDLSDQTIKNPYANPATSGMFTYSLTVVDANNCPVTKSVNITKFNQLFSTTLFADSTICTDSTITLVANTATGGVPFVSGSPYLYTWKNSSNTIVASTQNGDVTIITADSTFHVVVEDSKGCMDSSEVTVHSTHPFAELGPDVFATGNTTVTLDPQSTGNVGYDWYTHGNNTSLGTAPTLAVTLDGKYYVIVEDLDMGCRVSDTVNVKFTEGNPELIYVPNAFSPEAANAEDQVIKLYGEGLTADGFEFKIYNRWGDLVYSTNNLVEAKNTGWHGVSDNKDENQQNVFTYSVKGKYVTGKSFEQTGTITLVR